LQDVIDLLPSNSFYKFPSGSSSADFVYKFGNESQNSKASILSWQLKSEKIEITDTILKTDIKKEIEKMSSLSNQQILILAANYTLSPKINKEIYQEIVDLDNNLMGFRFKESNPELGISKNMQVIVTSEEGFKFFITERNFRKLWKN